MGIAALAAEAEGGHMETDDALADAIRNGEASAVHARDLLLQLRANNARREQVKELKAAIVDRYDYELSKLVERDLELREMLDAFIRQCNHGEKVSIPDAGTAYLTTKNKGGKLTIADETALLEWITNRFPLIAAAHTISHVDLGRAFKALVDELGIRPTSSGEVIAGDTGEVIEPLPGIGAEAESQTLAVRSA